MQTNLKYSNKVLWKTFDGSDTVEQTEGGELQSFAVSEAEVHGSFRSLVLMAILFNSQANGYWKKQKQSIP